MNGLPPPIVVMTIDDEPENLNVLGEIIRMEGWDVRAFTRGAQALAAAQESPPHLILLDVRMPGWDGYETCRRFKDNARLSLIPIIFLSANVDTVDKIRGFEAGGVDYVTKPFSEHEVLARSRTHVHLYHHQMLLEARVQERTRELVEAHRRLRIWDEAKTDWINMLSHEMRTPLTGVFGIAELLFGALPQTDDIRALRDAYDVSRHRMEKLVDDASMIGQIQVDAERFQLRTIPVAHSLHQGIHAFTLRQTAVTVRAVIRVPESVTTQGLPDLLCRAWVDLLLTTACCVSDGGYIVVSADCEEGCVRIRMVTNEQGLPEDALASFFDVGGQRVLLKGGGDFGLGPALARRILRLFGGQVSVSNAIIQGVVIEARLPTGLRHQSSEVFI